MTVNLKINLDAAIRWEKLTDRPFTSLNYADEEDFVRLCYCATLAADPTIDQTFESYRKAFETSKKMSKATMQSIKRFNAFMAQFQTITLSGDVKIDEITDEPERIERVASYLIVTGGMDAHYVLYDMPLEYIQMFVEGVAERTRQQMENSRFWTWLLLKPHDAKNAYPDPRQLMTFPWERASIEAEAARNIERHKEEINAFFEGKLFDPSKVKWKKRDNNK